MSVCCSFFVFLVHEKSIDSQTVLFAGERRIRVHTLCVPITNQLSDVFAGADQQAIASLLAKMGRQQLVCQICVSSLK